VRGAGCGVRGRVADCAEWYFEPLKGNIKVTPKQLEAEGLAKSQTSSTKLQINSKFQYSMSKTFPSIALHRFANQGHLVMMPLGITNSGTFVWNFEFGAWNLFEFWFFVLGIFMIFIKQIYLEISFNYLFK
jgi:hypothetical protein